MPALRTPYFAIFLFSLLMAGISSGADLDGVSGRLYKVNPETRSFELLKETEYDPKTDVGKSRFTVHWAEDALIVKLSERKDFSGLSSPLLANFRGIDDTNRKALLAGEAFVARVATLFEGMPAAPVQDTRPGRAVSGLFTPDPRDERAGTLEVEGQTIPVALRQNNWRIFHYQRIEAEALTEGFWSVTLQGAEDEKGRFIAKRLDVTSVPDPRLTDDPNLPRVLVIGDSISMNYHEAAKQALEGVANYHRIEGNAFSSSHGVRNAELWLGNYHEDGLHWDVICFNHGLHDLKQAYDAESDTFGAYAVSPEDYKAHLKKLIGILKETGATLVWNSTTPIPNDRKGKYARRKGAARVFNSAASEVMARHPDIIVNDLYGVVDGSPAFDSWREGNDVHFYRKEEQELLGNAVASAVKQATKKRSNRRSTPED